MKRVSFLLAMLLLIFVFAGCVGQTASADSQTVSGGEAESAALSATDSSQKSASTPGSGIADVDIFGEVTEIIGNEFTLKLMQIPEVDPTAQEQGQRNGNGQPSVRNYTGEEIDLIIPVGTPIYTRTPGINQSNGQAGTGSGTGPIETEINMKEIQKGWVMQVYYQDDGKTIDKVVAIKQRAAS